MPKVTFGYDANLYDLSEEKLRKLGQKVSELVAATASTPAFCDISEVVLDPEKDIDWLPMPFPVGAIIDLPVGIEIETIGFELRKLKMNEREIRSLKQRIANVLLEFGFDLNPDDPLVWVKFTDSDGVHV